MPKLLHIGLLILAVSAVAIADALLKKAAVGGGGFTEALKSPLMIGAILLYLFQIFFFTYIFVAGWKLSIVSILQTGLYALITLTAGVLFFGESLNTVQITAIVLTLTGVVLLNF
ncbi:MAG: hypothetical protein HY435_02745 [Candidatus Liptonbacteria bacterium]|nr:hypothetical protein [Candidatus Liptonbacteria bacterium]